MSTTEQTTTPQNEEPCRRKTRNCPPGGTDMSTQTTMTDEEHLKIAQQCFENWIRLLDGLLETAQIHYEEALGAGRLGDREAFGAAIGRAAAQVDRARAEIKAGLEVGA